MDDAGRTSIRRFARHATGRRTGARLYALAGAAAFGASLVHFAYVPGDLYHAEGLMRGTAFAVQAALLVVRSAAVLDLSELAGVRQAASPLSGAGGDRPPELRVRGPYRRLRHPLYAGLLLAMLGAPDMTYGRLSFALLSTAYIVAAIPWEERDMAARFGERYERYRTEVPWRLVPGGY